MKWINTTAKLLEFRNKKEKTNTINTEKQTINILEMDENKDRMLYNRNVYIPIGQLMSEVCRRNYGVTILPKIKKQIEI